MGSMLPIGMSVAKPATPHPTKPNILCILVDDLGYGDLSCQGFAKDIHTPNIDRLLNQGVRFTNFYANSNVSSPSRAALLTGRYPDLAGVPGVIRTRNKPVEPSPDMSIADFIRNHADESWGNLSSEAILLPQVLKNAGYHTAIVGKWHLGLQSPDTPTERGFDYFHGFLGDMMDDYYTHLRHNRNYMRENTTVVHPQGHASEVFSDWAIDYLNTRRKENVPFFLYLAYNAPHAPLQPPAEWLEKAKKREPNSTGKRAALVALIEHLDEQVGRVIHALETNRQLENTLIIFVSDNGGDRGSNANNGPLNGWKGQMLEGGIRVAAGIYWKGKIKPATAENFAMLMDIFPTVCQLTGTEITHKIDGISILPALLGEKQTTDDRTVFWVRREGGDFGGRAAYAARYKDCKVLQNRPYEPLQYFDLKNDPNEQTPLSIETSERYRKLFYELMDHVREAGQVPWQ
ncbi:MAG: sulfatase-like hydrolase/transferase [Prevotellaceae bacterium]|nr:sulfatase-like hydrolase/transferase [Prevotellaceae bacterium]